MSRVERAPVLIVGAGPTGMVLALALHRLGIPSVLLERRATPSLHPKAHELSSRSLEILGDLGVAYGELEAEASSHEVAGRVVFEMTAGDELGRIDLAQTDAHYREHTRTAAPYLNVSQTVVEKVLRDRIAKAGLVTLRSGATWKGMEPVGEGTRSTVVNSEGREDTIESRFVVACDGASSRVRQALSIEMVGPDSIDDFVNVYFEADLSGVLRAAAKIHFFFDPRCVGTLVAHHPERRWVYHTPIFGLDSGVEDHTDRELRARLVHAIGDAARSARFVSTERWRMSAQIAASFRRGNVFLAGDAAHRFPPTGGLGMNTGIADAHNLAWKLAFVCRGEASPALLDTYEAERRPVAQKNCAESVQNYHATGAVLASLGLARRRADAIMRGRVALLRRLSRAVVLPAFALGAWLLALWMQWNLRRRPARAAVARAVEAQWGHFDRIGLDLGATYQEGALVTDADDGDDAASTTRQYRPSTRPGSRLPHVRLDGDLGASTHDLIDPCRYTFVVGRQADPRTVGQLEAAFGKACFVFRSLGALETDGDLHAPFGLSERGIMLIRPDGYVAFRDRAGAIDGAAMVRALRGALSHVGASMAPSQRVERAVAPTALAGAL